MYGYDSDKLCASVLRFNSQRKDRPIEGYHLGNGHRTYSPICMRFNSPDTLSPHDEGGLNAYSYCGGDPINRSDPSGRSWIGSRFLRALSPRRNRGSKIPVLVELRPLQKRRSLDQNFLNASMDKKLKQHNQRISETKPEVEIRGFITEQYGRKFGYTVHRLSEGLPVMDPNLDLNIAAVSRHAAVCRRRVQENPSELNIKMATKLAEADKYLQSLQKQIRS
nr:RHS repeat-associated core domain-containing protein [Pseudomonas putida]